MFEKDLILPEEARQAFKEPLGREMDDSEISSLDTQTTLITVGDVVSLTFRRNGVKPFLSVYDGRTERREMTEFARLVEDEAKTVVENPAGTITARMAEAIRGCIEGAGGLVLVDGEEDLALLPCILYAPEGSHIVYGMPGRCMMLVTTDGCLKKRVMELMAAMEEIE